ncbi:hypothetical protein KTQ74_09645 [Pseudomonas chlororaphis]|uniref:hypothetical protein n=1 Tax=Pseudomonas chlororaphis TaxID=587753 RepID=UPI001E3A6785|nr:hypothetical protein [Pseudomonas chlororaphis]MCB2252159.1 hypothetical protein [Pseudomonas chlororaphis]
MPGLNPSGNRRLHDLSGPQTVQKTINTLEGPARLARSQMHAPYPQAGPQSLGASAKTCKPLSTGAAADFRKFFA